MRLLKLFILPLIISSLIVGSSNLDKKMSAKITATTLLYFFITSFLMASLGMILAVIFQPGSSEREVEMSNEAAVRNGSSVGDNFMDLGR